VMYAYAGSSAAATQLTPFTSPPQTTDPAAAEAQGAATRQTTSAAATTDSSSLLSGVTNALQQLASGSLSGGISQWLLDVFNSPLVSGDEALTNELSGFKGLIYGNSFLYTGILDDMIPALTTAMGPYVSSVTATASAVPTAGLAGSYGSIPDTRGWAGVGSGEVSAALGHATPVGGLSVPQAWGTSPAIRLASTSTAFPTASLAGLSEGGPNGAGSWFGGMPAVASVVNAPRDVDTRSRSRPPLKVGQNHEETLKEPTQPQHIAVAKDVDAVAERDELNQLRAALAALTRERDVLTRTAAFLIKEAQK
jgi:PPE-repeat protein